MSLKTYNPNLATYLDKVSKFTISPIFRQTGEIMDSLHRHQYRHTVYVSGKKQSIIHHGHPHGNCVHDEKQRIDKRMDILSMLKILEDKMLQNNAQLKSLIDKLWQNFWEGGIANPLTAIEQITYLIFMKRLDDLEAKRERDADFTGEKYTSRFNFLMDIFLIELFF